MKTIIYGGAFDPPQLAHHYLIEQLDRMFHPERIIIVPSWPRYDKKYKTDDAHRVKIIQIFIEELQKTVKTVELCEDFMLGKISETTTLGMDIFFKEHLWYSPSQVYGTDVIPDMPEWDPSGKVEREIPKIFIERAGFKPDMSKLDNYVLCNTIFPRDIARLSSTLVRANLKNGIYMGLCPWVEEYIREHNLYR